jgi:hypothetical protein
MRYRPKGPALLGYALTLLALLGVFALYTQPEFLVRLADQMWGCF